MHVDLKGLGVADDVGKVLMEYGSGICPLQACPVLSSKQTVWTSLKRLRKDVLAKDEAES